MIDGREASNKFEHLDASEEIFQKLFKEQMLTYNVR